jgi:hypothetical protein
MCSVTARRDELAEGHEIAQERELMQRALDGNISSHKMTPFLKATHEIDDDEDDGGAGTPADRSPCKRHRFPRAATQSGEPDAI